MQQEEPGEAELVDDLKLLLQPPGRGRMVRGAAGVAPGELGVADLRQLTRRLG